MNKINVLQKPTARVGFISYTLTPDQLGGYTRSHKTTHYVWGHIVGGEYSSKYIRFLTRSVAHPQPQAFFWQGKTYGVRFVRHHYPHRGFATYYGFRQGT